jgi:hypothetical protein
MPPLRGWRNGGAPFDPKADAVGLKRYRRSAARSKTSPLRGPLKGMTVNAPIVMVFSRGAAVSL